MISTSHLQKIVKFDQKWSNLGKSLKIAQIRVVTEALLQLGALAKRVKNRSKIGAFSKKH